MRRQPRRSPAGYPPEISTSQPHGKVPWAPWLWQGPGTATRRKGKWPQRAGRGGWIAEPGDGSVTSQLATDRAVPHASRLVENWEDNEKSMRIGARGLALVAGNDVEASEPRNGHRGTAGPSLL